GITNKWLSSRASKICVAYENLERFFPKNKIVLTGNPVREDLFEARFKKDEGRKRFNIPDGRKVLLILGGSLGSRRINQLIAKELFTLTALNLEVIWQCGKFYYDEYKSYAEQPNVQVVPF